MGRYHDSPGHALRFEFIASITQHPDVWLSIHKHKGFEPVFDDLRRHLGMHIEASDLRKMHDGIYSEYRQLSRYIAEFI